MPPFISQTDGERPLVTQAESMLASAVDRATSVADLLGDPVVWFAVSSRGIKIAIIVGLTLVIVATARKLIRRWQRPVLDLPNIDPRRQKVMTGSNLVLSVVQYATWAVAAIMVLDILGLNIGPVLAGAGIAGLAIGFGAQTLVRDIISGLLLLFDDIIHVGDLITFDGGAGVVEGVSLRVIKVRRFDGELVVIPAGELRTFGNKSMGFARAVVTVAVTYEQDTDIVLEALDRIAREWAARDQVRAVLLEDEPQVQAVMSFSDSAVEARIVVKVTPGEQFAAERALRLLIKQRFDEWGIEIPFPRRTLYVREEAEPPLRRVELPARPDPRSEDATEGAD